VASLYHPVIRVAKEFRTGTIAVNVICPGLSFLPAFKNFRQLVQQNFLTVRDLLDNDRNHSKVLRPFDHPWFNQKSAIFESGFMAFTFQHAYLL